MSLWAFYLQHIVCQFVLGVYFQLLLSLKCIYVSLINGGFYADCKLSFAWFVCKIRGYIWCTKAERFFWQLMLNENFQFVSYPNNCLTFLSLEWILECGEVIFAYQTSGYRLWC